jgi:heme exporter protein CcmB
MLKLNFLLALFYKEALSSIQRPLDVFLPWLFFIISLTSIRIALGPMEVVASTIFAMILITLYFNVYLICNNIYQNDLSHGFINSIILTNTLYEYIIAKYIFYCLYLCLFGSIFLMLTMIAFDLKMSMLISLLITLPIFLLTASLGAVINHYSQNNFFAYILSAPFNIPTMVFAFLTIENSAFMLLLLALLLFLLPIYICAQKFLLNN